MFTHLRNLAILTFITTVAINQIACIPMVPDGNANGNGNMNNNGNNNTNDNGSGSDPIEVERVMFEADAGYGSLGTLVSGVGKLTGGDDFADVAIIGDVTVGADSGVLQVLQNDGNGRFPGAPAVQTGSGLDGAFEVLTVDLTGDGDAEIIALDTGIPPDTFGGVVVFTNSGGFTSSAFLPGSDTNPSDVTVGDVDEDGHLDVLVVTSKTTTLSVYPGNGDGTFGSATTMAFPDLVGDIKLGDMDEDNHLDLLFSLVSDAEGTGLNQAGIMFGDGEGAFGGLLRLGAGLVPDNIAAADMDNDGHLDLIVGHQLDAYHIFFGDGNGAFGESVRPTGIGAWRFDVADVDGDGNLDLVGKAIGASVPQILYGDGERGFPEFQNLGFGPTTSVAIFQMVDINNDGAIDLVGAGSLLEVSGFTAENFTTIVKLQTP